MKAAIYNGPHDVTVTELPTPEVGPNDLLLRNLHAGICGSDVSAFLHGPQSHKISETSEFGHEVVSEVVAVGSGVSRFVVGERVYPYPLLAKDDPSRAGTLGGFSEFILVPNADDTGKLYPVSDAISDKTAALTEPFTIAMHAATRVAPKPDEKIVVFGAGTIGILTAISLAHLGCSNILIVDFSDLRLQHAAALGFAICNGKTDDVVAVAKELFGTAQSLTGETADVDAYIDAAGADSLIGQFQDIGKVGSRLVVVGVHARPLPVDFARLAYAQHTIVGSGGYTPEDVAAVLQLMETGKWDLESIVTHEFSLDEIVTALETASDPSRALNVSIVY